MHTDGRMDTVLVCSALCNMDGRMDTCSFRLCNMHMDGRMDTVLVYSASGDPRILAMGVLELKISAQSAPKIFATPTFGAKQSRSRNYGTPQIMASNPHSRAEIAANFEPQSYSI